MNNEELRKVILQNNSIGTERPKEDACAHISAMAE
jgi:hypothetical protein